MSVNEVYPIKEITPHQITKSDTELLLSSELLTKVVLASKEQENINDLRVNSPFIFSVISCNCICYL